MLAWIARQIDPPSEYPQWSEEQSVPQHVDGAIQHYLAYLREESEEHRTEAAHHWTRVEHVVESRITLRNLGFILLVANCVATAPRTFVCSASLSLFLFRVSGESGERAAERITGLSDGTKALWLQLGLIAAVTSLPFKPAGPRIALSALVGLTLGPSFINV